MPFVLIEKPVQLELDSPTNIDELLKKLFLWLPVDTDRLITTKNHSDPAATAWLRQAYFSESPDTAPHYIFRAHYWQGAGVTGLLRYLLSPSFTPHKDENYTLIATGNHILGAADGPQDNYVAAKIVNGKVAGLILTAMYDSWHGNCVRYLISPS